MTRRHLVPVAALALTLSACGSTTQEESGDVASQSPQASEGGAKTTETQKATCTLKGRESADVTLEDTGDALVATFDGQAVADQGTVLYSVTAFDEAGEVGVQLGMKYEDGEQVGYFVFDFGTAGQTNLDGGPEASGATVRGTFPTDALGELADVGTAAWSAAFNVNGTDVGTCPGGVKSLPFPG